MTRGAGRCVKGAKKVRSCRFRGAMFKFPSAARLVAVSCRTCVFWCGCFMALRAFCQVPDEIPYGDVEAAVQAKFSEAALNTNYLADGGSILVGLLVTGLSWRFFTFAFRSASNTD